MGDELVVRPNVEWPLLPINGTLEDVSVDICVDMSRYVYGHGCGHVCEHGYGHMHGHGCRQVFGHVYVHVCRYAHGRGYGRVYGHGHVYRQTLLAQVYEECSVPNESCERAAMWHLSVSVGVSDAVRSIFEQDLHMLASYPMLSRMSPLAIDKTLISGAGRYQLLLVPSPHDVVTKLGMSHEFQRRLYCEILVL